MTPIWDLHPNQLMKWSVVTQQVRIAGLNQSRCGQVLRAASVGRDARLASWTAAHPNLRWASALKQFHATETGRECLPLIRSETFAKCGTTAELQGGVTAGSKAEVEAKRIRPVGSRRWFSWLTGGEGPSLSEDGAATFQKLERSGGGKLKDVELRATPERVRFFAKIDRDIGQVGSKVRFSADSPVATFEKSVQRQGNTLTATENMNGLLRAGLTVYDLNLPRARLGVQAGPVVEAESLAQKVVSKMSHDGKSLADAAKGMEGPSELRLVGRDAVAYELGHGTRSPKFVVMSSGGGITGPPAGGVRGLRSELSFSVGGPDGGRVGDYLPPPPAQSVDVQIVNQADLTRLLGAALDTIPRTANNHDNVVRDVETALLAGDVAAASKALKPALHQLDFSNLSRLNEVLARARAQAARKGSSNELARLEFSVAIAARKLAGPEPRFAQELRGATRLLAPPEFPTSASTPPTLYPHHKVLKPEEQWVSRPADMPEGLARAPSFEDAAGNRSIVRALTPSNARAGERYGQGLRLAMSGRTAAIVLRCSDDSRNKLPRCTAAAPEEEQLVSAFTISALCSQAAGDDSGRKDRLEKCFQDAQRTCDTDHDEAINSDAERGCLRELGLKMRAAAPPSQP